MTAKFIELLISWYYVFNYDFEYMSTNCETSYIVCKEMQRCHVVIIYSWIEIFHDYGEIENSSWCFVVYVGNCGFVMVDNISFEHFEWCLKHSKGT